jgi:hypothetical protein
MGVEVFLGPGPLKLAGWQAGGLSRGLRLCVNRSGKLAFAADRHSPDCCYNWKA